MTLSVVTLDPLAEDSHDTLGTLNHVVMNPLVVLPDLFIRVRSVVAGLAAKLQTRGAQLHGTQSMALCTCNTSAVATNSISFVGLFFTNDSKNQDSIPTFCKKD